MKRIAALMASLAWLLLPGCSSGKGSVTDPQGFTLRFALDTVRAGLPLDTLSVSISLGNSGKPHDFRVDLRSGKSTAQVEAFEGQKYLLRFELFSAGYRIGGGTAEGTVRESEPIALKPSWDEANVEKARKQLGLGAILPRELGTVFSMAIAGRPFVPPLDSLKSILYRWTVKSGDAVVMSGEGTGVAILFPDSLAGRKVTVRILAVEGSTVREEQVWTVLVLGKPPADKVRAMRIRNDTDSREGSSVLFFYDSNGRLSRLEVFPALEVGPSHEPVSVESLYYDSGNRLVRAAAVLPDGKKADTGFTYDARDRLISMQVSLDGAGMADSFFYDAAALRESRRYVSGSLREVARYAYPAPDRRLDSVFTAANGGVAFTRLIECRFERDSLVERKVSLPRDALVPLTREKIAYNGFGALASRKVFTEGAALIPERTDTYVYDSLGRLARMHTRDEVTGELILAIAYEYEDPAFAKRANPGLPPDGADVSVFGAVSRVRTKVLEQARFAHEGWRALLRQTLR